MVSELIRQATRQQYEIQEQSLGLGSDETGYGGSDNDSTKDHLLELRFGTVAIPVDITISEAKHNESPATQPSQISLTQDEDEHIRKLDRSGALGQVIGSQSLLSQELVDYTHKNEPLLSQQTVDTTTMAKKLGLLEDEAEGDGCDGQETVITTLNAIREAFPSQSQGNDASQISLDLSQSFGTLLSAAQVFHEQEEVAKQQYAEDLPAYMDEYHDPRLVPLDELDATPRRSTRSKPKRKAASKVTASKSRKGLAFVAHTPAESKSKLPSVSNKKRKLASTSTAPIISCSKKAKPSPPVTISGSSQNQQNATRSKAQLMAKQAAELAEQAITNTEIAKRLLLTMALVRVNPRSAPEKLPGKGHVIPEGFHWAQYTPLEAVLKEHMAEYYDLSTKKCQSAQQQSFNNDLVLMVRQAADKHEWLFHDSFTDKVLRDRVRCYYKTHIQNAKKRLNTMVRNPTKKANARHLVQHFHLIKAVKEIRVEGAQDENATASIDPVAENCTRDGAEAEFCNGREILKDEEHSDSDEADDANMTEEDSGIVAEV